CLSVLPVLHSFPTRRSSDLGKLSHHSTSIARRDFFLSRLDHGNEIVPALRGTLQPLRRDLSRAGVDHHFADVDVSHLFVFAPRRQIECDSSPRARKAWQIENVRAGDAAGVIGKVLISLPVERT